MRYFNKKRFTMRQVIGLLTIVFLGIVAIGYAVTIPHTFTSGTTISSSQVNANFTAVKTAIDTLEDQANIGAPCDAGFTRVGAWCLDTDGDFTLLRQVISSSTEADYTTTVVSPSAKMAIIKSFSYLLQDGIEDAAFIYSCLNPGDSVSPVCGSGSSATVASTRVANEISTDTAEFIIRTDASGQVKTKCLISGSIHNNSSCKWFIVGYMD